MLNTDKYKKIYMDVLSIPADTDFDSLKYNSIPAWDSVGQMELLAEIEDVFGISLEPEEYMELVSYSAGITILKNHGIEI